MEEKDLKKILQTLTSCTMRLAEKQQELFTIISGLPGYSPESQKHLQSYVKVDMDAIKSLQVEIAKI